MDVIDKSILMALDKNCRMSYEALARDLGVSANAVRKRVNNLIESNIITDFVVLFSSAMTGAELLFLQIETDGCEDPEELSELLGTHPSVLQVTRVASGTGGLYIVFAEYVDSPQMLELSSYIRSKDCIVSVDTHPLLTSKGGKLELKRVHLRVLRALTEDARMQISEIARKSGMTARSARRALHQMIDSGALWFATRWDLAAGGSTRFFAKIQFDEKMTNHQELEDWLTKNYSLVYWYSYVSATEPILFSNFVVDHISEADRISRELTRNEFIVSAIPMIVYPTKKYPRIGMTLLEERIKQEGF
ncbi:MAG: winged helix-turn-helix transcriptional regulator [Candidatus Thorarchaeota archaeon]